MDNSNLIAKIKSDLLPHQLKFIESEALRPCFVGGYGAGKSYALRVKALLTVLEHSPIPPCVIISVCSAYMATMSMGMLRILKHYDIPFRVAYDLDQPTAEIWRFLSLQESISFTINGNEMVFGFQREGTPSVLIGTQTPLVGVSDIFSLKRSTWDSITSSVNKSISIHTEGEPEGLNWAYDKWAKNPTPEYELIHATYRDNPHVPKEQFEHLFKE